MTGSQLGRVSTIVLLTAPVFVFDTVTDLKIASAVFYIVVVLIAIRMFSRRGVILWSGLCILLTLGSAAFASSGFDDAGLINSGISVVAIATTTWLALRIIRAEADAHEARAQLIRIARVNSLGELAASIAHEVNQPLAAIATSGDACLRWLASDPPNLDRARLSAERVVSDANRASQVVARVREQVRGVSSPKQPIALNDVVGDALALAQSEINRGGIVVHLDLGDALPAVDGDPVQLQQVLGNLLLNAIEAMAKVPPSRRLLRISTMAAGDTVCLAVSDTGVGVTADNLPLLFEAFWTTKDKGTGMGLTICRTIVEAHGGTIRAIGSAQQGLEIQVSLPTVASP